MPDYKDTLNLPKTEFPMKANLAQREPAMLNKWKEMGLYKTLRQLRLGSEKFIYHDGPPYANGDIHIGHALNKILKDIVVKAKSLSGYDCPFVPGWDCHGLPIALNVEKKVGKPGNKISAQEFRKACREYAKTQVDRQRDSFKRLGILAEWDNPYLTMNYSYEADIIRTFAKIIANGHLLRGNKPVHWCLDCGSALAEAEVEYKDKSSPQIDVKFNIIDPTALNNCCIKAPNVLTSCPTSIPIWTTTPWTLPANQAIALHPDFDYVVVQCKTSLGDERLIIAKDLLESTMNRYGIETYQVIASCKGSALEGLKLHHPFYDREVPVILGKHVTLETGTGAVHTAPGHGHDDYIVGKQYGLPIDNPVDGKGCFVPDTPLFAGVHVNKANPLIIEILEKNNVLLFKGTIQHSYPHCWRHKTPLIFRATPQWFISMDQAGLRQSILNSIKSTTWYPDWGQARIEDMITKRPDWCVSRQRTWGVPLSLFIHKETGDLHPETLKLMEAVSNRVEKEGIEAWYQLNSEELLGENDAKQYTKSNDTLDVWFDSGVSHACVLAKRKELGFPADLYLEGSDQHRGWFQTSLITSCATVNSAPFHKVLTHGFTVDADGHKMSKSLGNVIAPDKVINSFGADILRLWVSSNDYRSEISLSDEILKRASDTYRRIRNTARFLLSNLYDFDPSKDLLPSEKMLALDAWAVDKTRLTQEELREYYDEYQFHLIYHKIHNFCANEMGSFYLDIIKDRQYTTQKNSLARKSAQTAMYHILEALTRWISPILSFTADEIWQLLPGKREDSIFYTTWYENLSAINDNSEMNQDYWQKITEIRNEVNKEIENQRNNGALGSALEAEIELFASPELKNKLDKLQDELRFILITSDATVNPFDVAPNDAIETGIKGLKLKVNASTFNKCMRCWHRRKDVGKHTEHPELCSRCIENIMSDGEKRKFA